MLKKAFTTDSTYCAPSIREVKASLESGFAASIGVDVDDYTDGNLEW